MNLEDRKYDDILNDIISLNTLIDPKNDEDINWYVRDMIADLMEEALEKIKERNGVRI